MTTVIGQELKKWSDSLKKWSDLDPYDITVANIILDNFWELKKAGGVSYGKRAMKFAELVKCKKETCDNTLNDILESNISSTKKIKRINALKVNSFRGFANSREFKLGKKYVFLYGPNGSGKTSFSEALEYGLLGNIEEANADNIKLPIYIKNTVTKKAFSPIIECLFEDGSEGIANENYEMYRFSFVEKNRINDFSHISGLTEKNQRERMAALFGLSEFTSFVQGFTRNFDDRYLSVNSKTEEIIKNKEAIRDVKEKELSKLQEELENLKKLSKKKIAEISQNNSNIENIQQAIDYYDNSVTGVLTNKIQNKDKSIVKLLDYNNFYKIKNLCQQVLACFNIITNDRRLLANKALEVNYKQLYEIISKLDDTNECPACGTSITNVIRNPYLYAREKIVEYKEIDKIKKEINEIACKCKRIIDDLTILIEKNLDIMNLLGMNQENLNKVAVTDIEKMEFNVTQWFEFSAKVINLSEVVIKNMIDEYNKSARENNNAYTKEVELLKSKEKELIKLSMQLLEKEKQINDNINVIKDFDRDREKFALIINSEKKQADFNIKIIRAYTKIIESLYSYVDKLPEMIAHDLEDKIVDYYNQINNGDADFEMLSDICLPIGESNTLVLTFKDGSKSDALQVLSEGHIKILGLAILLSKAIKDKKNFIIFDDIVNAIDDEHRNGVADLLMKNEDFKDVQIILSTHGEEFVLKLKDRLEPSIVNNDLVIYKFLPADSLKERGVHVEYSDSKTPIEAAQKNFENNDLRDAASKCRQAMESIAYNLWNKMSKSSVGEISVVMRSPKEKPDLSCVVDALIKKTKKISGMELIKESLQKIKQQDNWRVLNKGTHYEIDSPEFDREDVKNVLNILSELDTYVKTIKINQIAKDNINN